MMTLRDIPCNHLCSNHLYSPAMGFLEGVFRSFEERERAGGVYDLNVNTDMEKTYSPKSSPYSFLSSSKFGREN